MNTITEALAEVQDLYTKLTGSPAPEIPPGLCCSFPVGVDPIEHAIQGVKQLRQISGQLAAAPRPGSWIPLTDVLRTEESWVVRVEIPGVSREDLEVFVMGTDCVIRGNRKPPAPQLRPVSIERPWGTFERRIPLPVGGQEKDIDAQFVEGILELRIPIMTEVAEENRIKVN